MTKLSRLIGTSLVGSTLLGTMLIVSVPCLAVKKIEVSWWSQAGDGFKAAIEEMSKIYESKNPGVKVMMTILPDPMIFNEKLLARVIGNAAPDVVFSSALDLEPLFTRKQLADLSPFMKRDKFDIGTLSVPPSDMRSYDGKKLYGIPALINNYQVWYNKGLFAKAGLPNPKADWTTQSFLETAKKLTSDVNNDGKTDIWGIRPIAWEAAWAGDFLAWVSAFGGALYNADRTKYTLDSPEAVAGIQFVTDLNRKYKVAGYAADNTKYGMWIGVNREFPMMGKLFPKVDYGIVPHPRGPKSQPFSTMYNSFSIPAASKNKELAWGFLKLFASDAGQRILMKNQLLPVTKVTGRQLPGVSDENRDAIFNAMDEANFNFLLELKAPMGKASMVLGRQAFGAADTGKMSVAQAMASIKKQVEMNLAEGWRRAK